MNPRKTRPMKRGLRFVGLVVLLIAATGCGSSEEDAVEEALASFAESEHHRQVEEASCTPQDAGWGCTARFTDGAVITCDATGPSDGPEFMCEGPTRAPGGCERLAGWCFEAGNEPRIAPRMDLCADVRSGGKYVAFRVIAKGATCKEAIDVAKAAVGDGPPAGWACNRVRGEFMACTKGRATVGFNR